MRIEQALCAAVVAIGTSTAWAQTSEYVVVSGDNGDLAGLGSPRFLVITAGAIDRSWAPAAGTDTYQYPIAVGATVRTVARDAGFDGAEYDLAGFPLGATYTHPASIAQGCLDGTTDGLRNYTLDFAGTVWRCDGDWSNPVALFTIPSGDLGTITYDRVFGTLWIGRWSAPQVEEYELDGTPGRTFATGHVKNTALAMDPRDGTLWLHDRTVQGTYEQWTREGVMLQRFAVPGADVRNSLGGEFQFPQCAADLDVNGQLNVDDIDVFVDAFLNAQPLADLDHSGVFNVDDIDLYVASFIAGCP